MLVNEWVHGSRMYLQTSLCLPGMTGGRVYGSCHGCMHRDMREMREVNGK